MKQKLTELKRVRDKPKVKVVDFNTPLSVPDRTNRQDRGSPDNPINQGDLTDTNRTFYPITADYTYTHSFHV